MMWLSSNYSFELLVFYGIFFYIFTVTLFRHTRNALFSILVSLLIILVGSEYYELPIFVCGYLGLAGYGFPHVLNHVIVAVMFGILVWVTDMKFTKTNVLALLLGPLITVPLLLAPYKTVILYLARAIGLTILFVVAINSPGVGGSKSKMP